MRRRRSYFFGGVLALLFWAKNASAELAAIATPLTSYDGALFQKSSLSLERASTTIECDQRSAKISCTISAEYQISNFAPKEEFAIFGVFTPGLTSGESFYESGTNLVQELDEQERSHLRAASLGGYSALYSAAPTKGVKLRFAPGQSRTLTFSANLTPVIRTSAEEDRGREPLVYSALVGRHLGFAKDLQVEASLPITQGELSSWSSIGRIEIEVRYPSRWQRKEGRPVPKETSQEKKRQACRYVFDGPPSDDFSIDFALKEPFLEGGGPIFAFGGLFNQESPFVTRFGYEAGQQGGLLYSAVLDTNFKDRVSLTPSVMFATPLYNRVPSFGLSVGAPLLVQERDLRLGVRVQLDAMLGPFGLVVPIDVYPGVLPGDPERRMVGVLGQVSF